MARRVITIEELQSQVFDSKHYGKFIILNEEPRLETSPHDRRVKIRFLNTGNEYVVQLGNALLKNVRDSGNPDMSTPRVYSNGKYDLTNYMNKIVNTSRSGQAQIIADYGYSLPGHPNQHMVRVKFLNTGSEKDVVLQAALSGKILDRTMIGNASTSFKPLNSVSFKSYIRNRWYSMMNRCYNINNKNYGFYGGIGITVCDRWHDFDNYATDLSMMHGYELFLQQPALYEIDKDYIQNAIPKQNHVYSPDTCIWLDRYSNGNIIKNMIPTVYNGVMYNKNGVFALLYNYINCSLVQYGPFIDVKSASRFFLSHPIYPEIAKKLPNAMIPEPGEIVFKEYRSLYNLI